MRRVDYLFLAMIAFAAAVASVPPPPRTTMLADPQAWAVSDRDRLAWSELDLSGSSIGP